MSKSIIDTAISTIDAQIADLERAKVIIRAAALDAEDPVVAPKKRGRKAGSKNSKPGLPAGATTAVQAVGDLE